MIRYDLICANDHRFDGWFRDSGGFDTQCSQGTVMCPHCGSSKVEKTLMTPGLPIKSNAAKVPAVHDDTTTEAPGSALDDPQAMAFRLALRALRSRVEANSDYVGDRFAEEARRIYYAEAEPVSGSLDGKKTSGSSSAGKRGIYGEATLEDAKALYEEGIDVLPLPVLPEDKN